MTLTEILWAFMFGGFICVLGQLMMDFFKLTPAHTMCTLVVAGAVLGVLGWYQPLVDFAGAGATTPIVSFGNSLVKGAIMEYETYGLVGVLTGIFEVTGAGVSSAIIFSFLAALITKPKS